jgi:hypothetical protein
VRRGALTKLVNQIDLLVSAVLVTSLALFALLGSSLASQALPFAVAAFAGFVLGFIAITDEFPDWLQGAAGLLTVLALVGWGLMLASDLWEAGWMGRVRLWDQGIGNYAYAFAFGCVILLVRRFLFPSLFPDDPEEAMEQGRSLRRGVFVVGGLSVALLAAAVLVIGFLALISYLAARFG